MVECTYSNGPEAVEDESSSCQTFITALKKHDRRRETNMTQREVVVLSGVRTAIGDYGGGLKDKPPTELGAAVVREAVKRAGIQPAEVEHVVFGNVIHTDVHDMYLARVVALNGGLS